MVKDEGYTSYYGLSDECMALKFCSYIDKNEPNGTLKVFICNNANTIKEEVIDNKLYTVYGRVENKEWEEFCTINCHKSLVGQFIKLISEDFRKHTKYDNYSNTLYY